VNLFGDVTLRKAAEITAAANLASLFMRVQGPCAETLWVGGSTLRDILTGSNYEKETDIDIFFFNGKERSKSYESEIEAELKERSGIQFLSVKNQARMGPISDGVSYDDLLQTVMGFPDVSIALAARIVAGSTHTALVFAPYGLPSKDFRSVSPTSHYVARHGLSAYYSWLERKKYEKRLLDWEIDSVCRRPSNSKFYLLTDQSTRSYSTSFTYGPRSDAGFAENSVNRDATKLRVGK
jgi:hypothetical protein